MCLRTEVLQQTKSMAAYSPKSRLKISCFLLLITSYTNKIHMGKMRRQLVPLLSPEPYPILTKTLLLAVQQTTQQWSRRSRIIILETIVTRCTPRYRATMLCSTISKWRTSKSILSSKHRSPSLNRKSTRIIPLRRPQITTIIQKYSISNNHKVSIWTTRRVKSSNNTNSIFTWILPLIWCKAMAVWIHSTKLRPSSSKI